MVTAISTGVAAVRSFILTAGLIAIAAGIGWIANSGPSGPIPIPEAAAGRSEADPRPIKENVIAYHTRDEAMTAAKNKARETLPRFRELIDAKTAGTYTVKFPLTQNGATEHIWMQLSDYRDDVYYGRLANAPVNGNQYKKGDRMQIAESDVEDWMVNTGAELYGGYTARVMLSEMPKEKAEALAKKFRD